MATMTDQERNDQLEKLIDAVGLAEVLNGIAQVCNEKADHLRSNWQDESAAKAWEKAGTKISNTVATTAIGGVSP